MQQRLEELQKTLYTAIPVTKHMCFNVVGADEQVLVLNAPLEVNRNNLGTAFAGSLNTLAILAGWSTLWLILAEQHLEGDIVIQDSSCKYLLPVRHDFTACCYKPEAETINKFACTLKQKGRARLEIKAEIYEGDAVAVVFQGRYVVQSRQPLQLLQ